MNARTGLFGILGLTLLVGCDSRESQERRAKRFEMEASQALREDCERVIGYRRTLNSSIHRTNDNPACWTASATVEFINALGGVEATNLSFYFRQHADFDNTPRVVCFLREPTMEEIFIQAYQAELRKHGRQ